jgi:hypothetical protein
VLFIKRRSFANMWRDKIQDLTAIWRDQYPPGKPRPHSLIEKMFCTIAIVLCLASLSNFRNLLPGPKRKSHNFMDVYVIVWVVLLSICLFSGSIPRHLTMVLAIYRVFDIVSYRIFFLLVKSEVRPWTADTLRRSLVIVLLNFFEIVVAFAILYAATGSIASSAHPDIFIDSPGLAFYYSLITISTVGYGDYVPANSVGRALAMVEVSTMLLFLIYLLPALISTFSSDLAQRRAAD